VIALTRLSVDGLLQTPPPAGFAYIVLDLEATRVDEEQSSVVYLDPGLSGASNVERSSASDPVCFGGTPANHPVQQGDRVRHASRISVRTRELSTVFASLGLVEKTWFAVR
jgi:hypothetical protein